MLLFLVTGRLPWHIDGIKCIQCVSDQKSAFSPLQEKLCVGSKNDWHLLQSLGRSENWCFFCMSRLVCLRVGDIVQTSIVWRFMSRFFMPFSAMFWEGTALSGALHGSHLHSPGVATIFREIAVKNYEKSRNRRKRLCAPLRIDSWEIWRKFHCSSLGQKM